MENHARFPIIVLRIEISPEESSALLEEQLLRINGVYQVAITREKERVTIIGDVDPLKLVKYIAKMGKRTELVKYKKPKTDQTKYDKSAHDYRDKRPNGGNQNSRHSCVGCPDDHPHCKVKDSFHHDKYRPAAKDVEEETLRERHGQFRSFQRDNNYRASKESGEACQDQHGQFHSARNGNYGAGPGKKVEEETSWDPYGQFHSFHSDKYHSAAKGVEEEMCPDQYAQFHGSSVNAKESVPPMNNEGAKRYACPDNHPHCNMEHSTHHGKYQAAEEMNQGRCGQFYGGSRSTNGFVPPKNTDQDAKYCFFPGDDDHHHAAGKGVQEEMGRGRYEQFHGRTRNSNYEYSRPRYDENTCGNNKDHPHMKGYTIHEAKIEEVIKEAKEDMDRFFIGIRGRSNDHFPVGSSAYHRDVPIPSQWTRKEPPADDHYQNRNPPPPAFRQRPKPADFEFREEPAPFEQRRERMAPRPPSPTGVCRGRSGTRYEKFTNFFSDENPSSCTIV